MPPTPESSDPEPIGRILPQLHAYKGNSAALAQRLDRECAAAEDKAKLAWGNILGEIGTRYTDAFLHSWKFTDERQRDVIDQAMKFCVEISANVKAGRNVVIFGQPGTGKDHILVALMRRAVHEGHSVKWVNGMDLYGDWRDGIGAERSERLSIDTLAAPDVLAISDPLPPTGALTQFQQAMLFRLIDKRYRNAKPVWITVNVANANEAIERLGAAVVDRLREGSMRLWCNWKSYRERESL